MKRVYAFACVCARTRARRCVYVIHQWSGKCRLRDDIKKTIRSFNLINHDYTNLNDPWFRTLDHKYFQICLKLSEINTFNNYLCYISINIRILF